MKTLPQVIEEPNNKWPGDYTFGVIHVRSLLDCQTLAHEFIHAWQDERDGGPARTYEEWWARKLQAEQLSRRAMQ